MPPRGARSRLQDDIQAAGQEVVSPHIRMIGKGDVQDEFIFAFNHPQIPRGEVEIHVMPQDTVGYPGDNYFLVYTNDEVPSEIRMVLDDAMTSTRGMLIIDLLKSLSRLLCDRLDSTGMNEESDDHNAIMTDAENDPDSSEISDDSDSDVPFDYGDEDDFGVLGESRDTRERRIPDVVLQRIRQDFRAVRNAGFRVGKICGIEHISEYSIMAMSVKASKLCLSEETHTAWNLGSSDYLVLLMKYSGNYLPFEDAIERPTKQLSIEFRLRRCSRYRPTLAQAIAAFSPTPLERSFEQPSQISAGDENSLAPGGEFLTFGVGGSIDLLLESNFLDMMKLRKRYNVSWDEAKRIQSQLNKFGWDNNASMNISSINTDSTAITDPNLPPILMSDHLSGEDQISLPLVAMQFSLRYLVKCTDYCMICHEKTTGNFEAIKPYVCSNPLCLFQYMNIGLGPSIDHEIIHQENVVDLLISFCYASLFGRAEPSLREFPLGMNLQVPRVRGPSYNYQRSPSDIQIKDFGALVDPREVEICWPINQVRITNDTRAYHPALAVGNWVVIHTHHDHSENIPEEQGVDIFHYARIEEKNHSTIRLHIASRYPVPMRSAVFESIRTWQWDMITPTSGQLVLCNQSLDDLETDVEKAFSLILLLSALPSVNEMRSYLMANQSRRLATWNRIPSEAMRLLRWIIASNRSFIVQLDNPSSKDANPSRVEDKRPDRSGEKITGVDGWIQFRFAQGSPEKEALFLDATQEVENPHRTILAWHGSGIGNWHSIIREGLNFNVVSNGRAHGDGVYFSRSFEYSLHYTAGATLRPTLNVENIWPQSSLQITHAISLNELVNLPKKFKHSETCYVVDILHWIQCRYLFVRPKAAMLAPDSENETSDKGEEFKQDPEYAVTGPFSKKLFVPKIAIPSVRGRKHCGPSSGSDTARSDDTDDEDTEDIKFLSFEDNDTQSCATRVEPSMSNNFPQTPNNQKFKTDFRPGSLDFSELPQLALPSYATRSAQQVIQRELQKLEKIQSETPLHELGWYIDFEKIDNMFQWIVELHSFDPSLPLAQDMKKAGTTSIVVEIQFLRGFPVTPPFVRVIKPRFLPFAKGGGGHVTSGGAMCMELLTNTGWSPVSSMESVLLQVRLAMSNLEPRPARLEKLDDSTSQYSYREAVRAAIQAHTSHGWEVPVELTETLQP
ncbi:hypothetical protein F5Y12DRAFT_654007 [Xylaria sp. FL1777]|nr:hypothetical protein F5Y12DRAFT_654007 [Xylaria sp. FL1777]